MMNSQLVSRMIGENAQDQLRQSAQQHTTIGVTLTTGVDDVTAFAASKINKKIFCYDFINEILRFY
jgi:hypothetical protein